MTDKKQKKEIEKDLPDEISQGEEIIENKEQEYLDGWKRCQADFENYKKRQQESQKDFVRFAAENIIHQILPVLDNFHSSTDHIPEDQKNNPWVVGIMHIQKQLENVLKDNGVEEIEVKVGDEFDPNLHEAISDNSKDSKENPNDSKKIQKIMQNGYKLGDKIIRAAKVIVE